jgi:hypothetical protein
VIPAAFKETDASKVVSSDAKGIVEYDPLPVPDALGETGTVFGRAGCLVWHTRRGFRDTL